MLYNIITDLFMRSQVCSSEVMQFLKLRVAAVLFLGALLMTYLRLDAHVTETTLLQGLRQKIGAGPTPEQPELAFQQFMKVLVRNPFSGTWVSSIKQSKLLKQENGTIQLKAIQKNPQDLSEGFMLDIQIFDGEYRDAGNLKVQLDTSSIRTQQQFVENHLIYETLAPSIAMCAHEDVLLTSSQKPIFINKLKFRIHLNETLKIQLLLAAEYEINIITQKLQQNWTFFNQMLFSLVILVQVVIQALGAYWLMLQVDEQDMIAKSLSPTFFKLGMAFDVAQIFVLVYLIIWQDCQLLTLPTYLLVMSVLYLQTHLLHKIQPFEKQQQQLEHFEQQIDRQITRETVSSLQQQNMVLPRNPNSLSKMLIQNQLPIICILGLFVFYVNNMRNYIYSVYYLILLLPQLTRNCRTGNKVNYSLQSILAFAYPRLLPILYTKFAGNNSLFVLEPRYIFCLFCVGCMLASCALLLLQQKLGARAILPKFLIPKGLKTKFKFFMIKDQNITCTICGCQLACLPLQLRCSKTKQTKQMMKQQIEYNKVVLTPCHHKFHAFCLDKWMETRVQCPGCTHALPPTEGN